MKKPSFSFMIGPMTIISAVLIGSIASLLKAQTATSTLVIGEKHTVRTSFERLEARMEGRPVVLVGATVYDGNGGPPIRGANILIAEGKISCIGSTKACPAPSRAEIIELGGTYITPGLVNSHVHYDQRGWPSGRSESGGDIERYDYERVQASLHDNPDRWHRSYICSGVTSVYDVGGLPWTLGLEAAAENHPLRPHIRAAGPMITPEESVLDVGALGTKTYLPMRTDEEAVASVHKLADMGAQAVKVWYNEPDPNQIDTLNNRLQLIGREAREQGLPLLVHALELRLAKAALRAGADVLVHSVEDEPIDEEFIRLAQKNNVIYVPTLNVGFNRRAALASVVVGIAYPIDDPNGCVDQVTRQVIADAPSKLRATLSEEQRALDRVFAKLEEVGQVHAIMEENLRRVHEAGIRIATGTDAGSPLTLHGPSIYQEMEAMEAAGIPATDILVMSTRNGASAMGRFNDFGSLEPGKIADLVVLEEDPGVTTQAFRSIKYVMRSGNLHEVDKIAAH